MSNEEKILLMLEGLNGKVEGLNGKVEGISNDLKELSSNVKKQGVVLENLVSKVEKLEERMDRLEERMDRLKENQVELEQIVTSTKEIVVMLENEQSQRIGVLFDADVRLHDMFKETLTEVRGAKLQLNIHAVDLSNLNQKLANMEHKINKLWRAHENELNIA